MGRRRKKSESWAGRAGRRQGIEWSGAGVPLALLFLVSCKARRQEGNGDGGDAMDGMPMPGGGGLLLWSACPLGQLPWHLWVTVTVTEK